MRITVIFIAFLMGVSGEWSHACAQETGKLPSFPGAEGFGRYTTGGRGGTVYHVTTLEDGDLKALFAMQSINAVRERLFLM